VRIDFRIAGLGDAWMRLMALSTLSRIRPRDRHVVYPPAALVPLARMLFDGYFGVENTGPADIEIRHHGLRELLPGLLAGKRYYSPFYWSLRATRAKPRIKDTLNDIGYFLATKTTRLSRPDRRLAFEYQGFVEMQGLQPFRNVSLAEYLGEAGIDFEAIGARAASAFPSGEPSYRTVVFPSGTAHQIMSPDTAARLFPSADFAFFERDDFAKEYAAAGLSVVKFGGPPEEVCRLIASASTVYCTDSFPFHLAQMWKDSAILMLTEMKIGTTVHPSFPMSHVIESRAECHPCRHLVRTGPDHRCEAGRMFCITWENPAYLTQIRDTVLSQMPQDMRR
jgi:hypothetical protein